MPLYAISTEEGTLSADAKSALALEITEFHCKLTGLDKDYVKIIFNIFPRGNGFVAGETVAAVILTVLIRSGRSADYKRSMLLALWEILKRATKATDRQMLLAIQEAPASQGMEMGQIMPDLDG
jgi:phenylpyruvate tautomerase PptA (4-oxalocrotonate tautomerase family)